MTIGITVMVSQLYVELDEFSNTLLIAAARGDRGRRGGGDPTVLLVLPLHVGRVARVAARQQLEALGDLVDRCLARLADPASAAGSDLELRASARRVDVAHQAMTRDGQADADAAVRQPGVAGGRVHGDHRRRPALRAEPAARRVHPVRRRSTRGPPRSSPPPRRQLADSVDRRDRGARARRGRWRPGPARPGPARPALRPFGVAVRAGRGPAARTSRRSAGRSWRCATSSCSTARWPRPRGGRACRSARPRSPRVR